MRPRDPFTVTVRTPALVEGVDLELRDDEALLVGRDPDVARVPAASLPAGVTLRPVKVAGPSVSGNHALAWRTAQGVAVRDLESRNGTALRMPPGSECEVRTHDHVTLELAATTSSAREPATPAPRDARWADAGDFPDAVAREVGAWLEAVGVPVSASARRRAAKGASRGALPPVPLVDDWVLELVDTHGAGTLDPLRGRVIETVVAYVHAQCVKLRRERGWSHNPGFVLASPAMREAHARVADAAETGYPLILLGETGAGKGTLARCYHQHSARGQGPFEPLNCAEVDAHFARTRLFGARKGAYTGCHADVQGVVELAHRGTLFLDEVAELPLDVQGELLTFLDDQRFKRFGDEAWRQVDVRVVCGTNVDLRSAVREGRFRADLWYRLAGRVVEVPPLRQRPEDLVAYLEGRSVGEGDAAGSVWQRLDEGGRRACLEHAWRGNFRELAGFVRRLPTRGLSITEAAAREAITEGALELRPRPTHGEGWEALAAEATEVFRARSKLDEPARAGEFREYVEDILKPLFFARALGLTGIDAVPERPTPSFEEMARRMGCDASTVKAQLARYVEIRRARAPRG